jgi:hypothetical protein
MPAGFKTFSNNITIFSSISFLLMFNMFFSIVTDQTQKSEDKIAGFYAGLEKKIIFQNLGAMLAGFKTSSNNITIFVSISFQLTFNMFLSKFTDQTLNSEDKIVVFFIPSLKKVNYFLKSGYNTCWLQNLL